MQDSSSDREHNLIDSKKTEFYSQAVAAWFASRLEHDKSLLTLSTAGVGVLVTIMQSAINSVSSLLLYIGAIIFFVICLVSVLVIFRVNTSHIMDVVNNRAEGDSKILVILDQAATYSFFLGMLFSAILGMSVAISTLHEKEVKMAEANKNKPAQMQGAFDSVNGCSTLQPVAANTTQMNSLKESFQGMAQLQGQSNPQLSQTAATQPQSNQAQSIPQKK